jgi:hypothetical protein
MKKSFSFDNLTDTDFEEFGYDLLSEIGFKNLNWRKGTGHNSSPADGGRDIECEWDTWEPDRRKHTEKWFVDCKNYKEGVSADKLQAALSWAVGRRPNVLLFIVSNFLSNPAKDYIEQYKANNTPVFRIKYWERPQLQRFCSTKPSLVKKYKLADQDTVVSILHPAHVAYLTHGGFTTMPTLLRVLEQINMTERKMLLSEVMNIVVESHGGKIARRPSYGHFKQLCLDWEGGSKERSFFLAGWIISYLLMSWLRRGDLVSVEQTIEVRRRSVEALRGKLLASTGPKEWNDVLQAGIRWLGKSPKMVRREVKNGYKGYKFLCEQVISKLLDEDIIEVEKLSQKLFSIAPLGDVKARIGN